MMANHIVMTPGLHDSLRDIQASDPSTFREVGAAITALLDHSLSLDSPLIVSLETIVNEMDSDDALAFAYQRVITLLNMLRRAAAQIASSRKRVELEIGQPETEDDKFALVNEPQRERPSITRERYTELLDEEKDAALTVQQFQARIDALRTRIAIAKAKMSSGNARREIDDLLTDIGQMTNFEDLPSFQSTEAMSKGRQYVGMILGAMDGLNREMQVALDGLLHRVTGRRFDICEIRLHPVVGQNVRVLFGFDRGGAIFLLAAGIFPDDAVAWYGSGLDLVDEFNQGQKAQLVRYEKESFLEEFFSSERSDVNVSAARLATWTA